MIAAILFIRLNLRVNVLGLVLYSLLLAGITFLIVFSFIKNWALFKSVTFIVALIFCLAGGIHFYIISHHEQFVCNDSVHIVSGRIDDINYSTHRIVLDDLRINGEIESGRLRVYTNFSEHTDLYAATVGDYLIFRATLNSNYFVRQNGTINAHAPRTNIRYRVYAFYGDVAINPHEANFFARLQAQMQTNLTLAMGAEYGAIAYGMITGDRSGVSSEIRDAYSASGLMHILAVSGLHVGFLAMGLFKFFKLLKVSKRVSGFIVIGVQFFYAFFVGFSPAILRAVIMSTIMILAFIFSRRYDSFNALCLAASSILVFAPFFLFDVGFLFSVGALSGIVFFSKPLARLVQKIKIPKFLATNLAVSISAQIGIMPAMIFFFESVQIYSIFTNLIIHPIIAVAFGAIFISVLLSMIWQGFLVLLQFSGVFIALIDGVVMGVSSFPLALFYVFPAVGALVFFCYLFYFLSSRYFLKPNGRGQLANVIGKKIRVFGALLTAIFFALIGVPLTRISATNNFIAPVETFRDVTSIVRVDNSVYVVGDFRSFNAIDNALRRTNVTRIDAIFLSELCMQTATTILRFNRRYSIGKVKTNYNGIDFDALTILANAGINNFFAFCGAYSLSSNFIAIMSGNRLLGYELLTSNGSVLFVHRGVRYTSIADNVIERSFAIRTHSFLDDRKERIFITNAPLPRFVYPDDIVYPPTYQFSHSQLGTFKFDFTSGQIYLFA